ncbi:AfsR/SARP family transcriptional regulator [Amycolatopsis saalfeldensis]|uniref:AfsR/SARP family transcriptional regulator n=1 Tax=Amycolatopsis saalfeldensis TaxID=394193 RepID=UPI000AE524F7|nr:AfsR/SARP family transcriptional regulator [Amycolatopsis saalfeldensis]
MIELRVLGEIELCEGERQIRIRGARQQGILAVLLIEANRPVTNDQLLERAWGTHRWPSRPRAALRSQITLLRRALTPADGVTITWQPAGYRLAVDTGKVDLHLFHRLVQEARSARNDEGRAELLHRACELRYGEPFASLDTPWLVAQRAAFEREHHAAQLDLIDTRLRQGQHAVAVTGLTDLSNAYPWDERVAGQLMLALYRSGRRVDALDHYQKLRHRFVEQLGTDPSPPLQHLHQQILTADSSLTLSIRTTSATAPLHAAVLPRQLPVPPRTFVGRNRELAHLSNSVNDQAEEDHQAGSATMSIVTIGGMGGVGKTALAVRWAHRHAEDSPTASCMSTSAGLPRTRRQSALRRPYGVSSPPLAPTSSRFRPIWRPWPPSIAAWWPASVC